MNLPKCREGRNNPADRAIHAEYLVSQYLSAIHVTVVKQKKSNCNTEGRQL